MMVGVLTRDLGSTFVPLTTARSLTVHDGRRLPRRPADKGRVFNHRALEIAPVNRQPARHSRNHEIKIQSINYQICVFMFGIQKTSNRESK